MNFKTILIGIVIGAMLSPLLGGIIGLLLMLIKGIFDGTSDTSLGEGLFYVVVTTESSIYLGWLVGLVSAAVSHRYAPQGLALIGGTVGLLVGFLTGVWILNFDLSLLILHLLTSIANGALAANIVGAVARRTR